MRTTRRGSCCRTEGAEGRIGVAEVEEEGQREEGRENEAEGSESGRGSSKRRRDGAKVRVWVLEGVVEAEGEREKDDAAEGEKLVSSGARRRAVEEVKNVSEEVRWRVPVQEKGWVRAKGGLRQEEVLARNSRSLRLLLLYWPCFRSGGMSEHSALAEG